MTSSRIQVAVSALVLAGLAGCAISPPVKTEAETSELLYDGDSKVLYDADDQPRSAEEALELANQTMQTGDIDRALYQFLKAYELDPANYEALYRVGTIHAWKGSVDRAALAFRLVLKAHPGHAEALTEYGLIALRRRDYVQAEKYLLQAIEQSFRMWRAHNGLGVLADLDQEFERAQRHYQNGLTVNPNSPVLLNNIGYSKYLVGDWKGAERHLRAALDTDIGYKRAWLNLGLILVRRGHYSEALAAFENVMERASTYERVGALSMMEGKYDVAEKYLNLAIHFSPTYYKDAYDKLDKLETLRYNPDGPAVSAIGDVPMLHRVPMNEGESEAGILPRASDARHLQAGRPAARHLQHSNRAEGDTDTGRSASAAQKTEPTPAAAHRVGPNVTATEATESDHGHAATAPSGASRAVESADPLRAATTAAERDARVPDTMAVPHVNGAAVPAEQLIMQERRDPEPDVPAPTAGNMPVSPAGYEPPATLYRTGSEADVEAVTVDDGDSTGHVLGEPDDSRL